MKTKILLACLLTALVFTGVVGDQFFSQLLSKSTPNKPAKIVAVVDKSFGWKFPVAKFPLTGPNNKQLAYSDIRDPGGIPQGLPIRLKIPVIGVDTAIEDAYITPDGRMDVPAGTKNVAWFALGPHPGRVGSAVIGGHYGFYQANKGQTVFYNLDKLKAGDKVYIEDDKSDTLSFVVRRIQLFDRNADSTTVFTSGDGLAHLNLITCEGVWNQVNDSYPDRRVVFTDAIPAEGAMPVKALPPMVAKPQAAAKAAVPSPAGSQDSEPMRPTIAPITTPEELIVAPTTVKKAPLSPNILIQSAKSLYATPIDGIITSFLLLSIILIAIKLIRRS